MAKSRELWKIIMKENHGAETEMWLQYFRLERFYLFIYLLIYLLIHLLSVNRIIIQAITSFDY